MTDSGRELYERERADLTAKQMANSTAYDNAILTLSSALLALSVTFIDDAFPRPFEWTWALAVSWVWFSLAIIGTVSSFVFGQRCITRLIDGAYAYYVEGKKAARADSQKMAKQIDRFNAANGAAFVLGVVFTLVFALANVWREPMNDENKAGIPGLLHRAQPLNAFEQKPAESPATSAAAAPPTEPAAQGAGQDQGAAQSGSDGSG